MTPIYKHYFKMKSNRDEEEWGGFENMVHSEDKESYGISRKQQNDPWTIGEVG